MLQTAKQFDHRVGNISKAHARAAKGISYRISQSGLIEARPRVFRPKLPIKGIATIAVSLLAFKAFLLAYLGPRVYQQRVDLLNEGTLVEQAGAWALQPDRVTEFVANIFVMFGV